jgi:anti-sigma factor RsiW
MSCRELVELVTEYLEGGLPEDERARFEAHLEACAGCVRYLEQILETVRLAGTAFR